MNVILIAPDENIYSFEYHRRGRVIVRNSFLPIALLVQSFSRNKEIAQKNILKSLENFKNLKIVDNIKVLDPKKDNTVTSDNLLFNINYYGNCLIDFANNSMIYSSDSRLDTISLDGLYDILQEKNSDKKQLLDFQYLYSNKIYFCYTNEQKQLANRFNQYIAKHQNDIDNIPLLKKDPFINSNFRLKLNKFWDVQGNHKNPMDYGIIASMFSHLVHKQLVFLPEYLQEFINSIQDSHFTFMYTDEDKQNLIEKINAIVIKQERDKIKNLVLKKDTKQLVKKINKL